MGTREIACTWVGAELPLVEAFSAEDLTSGSDVRLFINLQPIGFLLVT